MGKLGYTWYPKDWTNSEAVFELTLQERGLYRELIDLAMLNDNKTPINKDVWCRKWNIDLKNIEILISKLTELNLIEIKLKTIFIPSCESRLNLVRGGKKGGSKSKPKSKPTRKPLDKPLDKPNPKPTLNQSKLKEIETKVKEILTQDSQKFATERLLKTKNITVKNYNEWVDKFIIKLIADNELDKHQSDIIIHFNNWLNKQDHNSGGETTRLSFVLPK